jgi:predicted enzyme involved in methoxymalonyl-ACP biosynthesis
VFSVSDRFGDFGLTGLATVSRQCQDAQIVDFVMSCRVMGKKVEEALLGYVFSQALADGAVRIMAPAFEGPRNAPAREFFAGKYLRGDDTTIDPERVAIPSAITLKEESLAPA